MLDRNIDEIRKSEFVTAFTSLLNGELEGKDLHNALNTTLKFVVAVRNSIFHGTKSVLDMLVESQQRRIIVYTSILLSVNELLFDAIERNFEWSRNKLTQI